MTGFRPQLSITNAITRDLKSLLAKQLIEESGTDPNRACRLVEL